MKNSLLIGVSTSIIKMFDSNKNEKILCSIIIESEKNVASFRKFNHSLSKTLEKIKIRTSRLFEYLTKANYFYETSVFRRFGLVRAFDNSIKERVDNSIKERVENLIEYDFVKIDFNDSDTSIKYNPIPLYLLQSKYRKKKIPSRNFAVFRFS